MTVNEATFTLGRDEIQRLGRNAGWQKKIYKLMRPYMSLLYAEYLARGEPTKAAL